MNTQTETKNRQKVLIVGDRYRTNPLSLQPGGVSVRVHYPNGTVRVYDKIKNVEAYTRYMEDKFNVSRVEAIEQ